MRTIGLVGGMSWESSASYYAAINRAVAARRGGLHSARTVLVSVDFADIEPLQRAGEWDHAAELLAAAAQQAERAGAELLLLCTNTMHRVADEVAAAVSIPFLHIADATGERLVADGRRRVGLLGTRYTMEQGFYRERLRRRYDLEVGVPEATDRQMVDDVIFEELCRGQVRGASRAAYLRVIDGLVAAGAEAVVLGCTEIGLLVGAEDSEVPLYDTTALHAQAAVAHSPGCLDDRRRLRRRRDQGGGFRCGARSPTNAARQGARRCRFVTATNPQPRPQAGPQPAPRAGGHVAASRCAIASSRSTPCAITRRSCA